jgi:hypothetical protein
MVVRSGLSLYRSSLLCRWRSALHRCPPCRLALSWEFLIALATPHSHLKGAAYSTPTSFASGKGQTVNLVLFYARESDGSWFNLLRSKPSFSSQPVSALACAVAPRARVMLVVGATITNGWRNRAMFAALVVRYVPNSRFAKWSGDRDADLFAVGQCQAHISLPEQPHKSDKGQ